jgi:hypothetical protein
MINSLKITISLFGMDKLEKLYAGALQEHILYPSQINFLNRADVQLITCQNYGIRTCKVDKVQKKLRPIDDYFWKLQKANKLNVAGSFR